MKLTGVNKVATPSEFTRERAKIQYIANCTRPDLCAAYQQIAVPEDQLTEKQYKSLNKLVERCNSTSEIGLKYLSLDKDNLRLMLFTDASFGNAANLKSELGFVILLVDGDNRVTILD